MSEELKPCPFCGAQPVMIPRAVMYPDWWQCAIVHDGNDGHLVRVIATGDTAPEAIEAASAMWNRRAERTCKPEVLGAELADFSYCWERCSACGMNHLFAIEFPPAYCPTCGARVVRE